MKRYAVSAPRKLRDAFPLDPRERAEHTTRDDACGAKRRALMRAATSDRRRGKRIVPQKLHSADSARAHSAAVRGRTDCSKQHQLAVSRAPSFSGAQSETTLVSFISVAGFKGACPL